MEAASKPNIGTVMVEISVTTVAVNSCSCRLGGRVVSVLKAQKGPGSNHSLDAVG